VLKLSFISLVRKDAVSLKKMWLISEAKEITTPALGFTLLEMQAFQGTMPGHPARGLCEEHSILNFDAVICNIL
jgi:hypothetical protein